jgi:hypothetical protein
VRIALEVQILPPRPNIMDAPVKGIVLGWVFIIVMLLIVVAIVAC